MLQAAHKTDDTAAATPTSIGAKLRKRRQLLGLSQKAVGQEVGVDEQTVRRWEWDKIAVKRRYHDDLCRVLKMRLSDFNPY